MNSVIPPAPEAESKVEQIVASLHAQRDKAARFLSNYQARLKRVEGALEQHLRQMQDQSAALSIASQSPSADEELRRSHEMALDELRDLKAKYAELQSQYDEARAALKPAPAAAPSSGKKLDWEAEKNRILAALEMDSDDDPRPQGERRETVNSGEATENILAEKDRQIEELRRQLNQQHNAAKIEVERLAAMEQAIDDESLGKERQQLEVLRKEWEEKLRQAEIELSMERAKLARREAELNERAKACPEQSPSENQPQKTSGQPPEATGNRWLSRLGLTEADWTYRKRR